MVVLVSPTLCGVCLSILQVIQLLEKPREPALKHVFVDTPGQIEIFTWSASGQLITGEQATGLGARAVRCSATAAAAAAAAGNVQGCVQTDAANMAAIVLSRAG
jgi:hypothetical protein